MIDYARYLVGDISEVMAIAKTWIGERPIQSGGVDKLGTVKAEADVPKGKVDVDDEFSTLIKFDNGAVGSIEATRNAWGRNNFLTFEIHGEKGSLYFNYERRDELQVCFSDDPSDSRGFRTVYTGPAHPYGEGLWPIPALGIGYGETKLLKHMISSNQSLKIQAYHQILKTVIKSPLFQMLSLNQLKKVYGLILQKI